MTQILTALGTEAGSFQLCLRGMEEASRMAGTQLKVSMALSTTAPMVVSLPWY